METQIHLSVKAKYIIFTLSLGLIVAIIPDIFGLVAYLQFFVGLGQLIIAISKSLIWAIQRKGFPKQMQIYWLLVFVYFLIGGILWTLLNHFSFNDQMETRLGVGYLFLAWGIAVYHFNQIMFLKL